MESTFLMPKGRGRPRRSCEDSSATRAVRFSFEENCVLITKVCEYYQEIVGSATAKTPQRKKNELWRKIVDAVNAVGGNGRTELVVKKRYFDVKRQLKKKLCKAASHATDIGGEKSEEADLTSYEEELLRVLIPGTGVDFEGIVDTERSTTTERSRRKSNEARQKILDAFKTVRTDHSDRAVKRKYFDAKRQLRKNLYRTPFYGRRTGSSHLSHEGVHSEALIDTLALQTVMHIKGSVDTDLPLVSQDSRSPVRLNKEESMTSEQMQGSVKSIDCQRYVFQTSPCLEANEMEVSDEPSDSLQTDCPRYVFKSSPCSETHQMEGNDEPSASLQAGSPRYVFKTSPCAETHQLEVSDEPSGPLQTAVLSGDQEEIISIIVGSEEVPSTSASICPQSSAVSSSSSPLPGSLDASVTVFVHKTTEQLNKISDVMSTQSHTDESHHTEILEVLHDIRNDLAELRQQTQISNELQNQKRLDNKLFRDQLLQLKREKLDILRMKYGLGSPSSSKPLHEQQEESSSNEDEFSCSEIKKIHKDKERFILIL